MSGIVETIRLDKHKPDKRSEKSFNIFALLAILVVVLVLALNFEDVINYIKTTSMNRARTNAETAIERYEIEVGNIVSKRTLLIVEKSGKYYVFWYIDEVTGLVSFDNAGENLLPFKAPAGDNGKYPFESSPLVENKRLNSDGSWYYVVTTDTVAGFSMTEADSNAHYELFVEDKSWKVGIPENVKMYELVSGAEDIGEPSPTSND